jgi:hypothetical protein
MEEENKENQTWNSSASDYGDVIPTQIEENIDYPSSQQSKQDEHNVI